MVVNEQGLDSEQDYTAVDNPFWDCTEGAHPAWWRGEEYGVRGMVKMVNKWLDESPEEMMRGASHNEIQALKQRICDLRAKHGF